MSRDEERILESFDHHAPGPMQVERIQRVRAACKAAALALIQSVEPCADRAAALQKIHEGMMTANKAIVCEVDRRTP